MIRAFFFSFFIFAPLPLSAETPLETKALTGRVVVSEIMYDLAEGSDTGREWIEVYNSGEFAIDLTKWKVVESGKNHTIKSVSGGVSLPPGTFAIIADNATKFKGDHPDFSHLLFDSAFSLNNKGETIALVTSAGVESHSVIYTSSLGANGTGDSLQNTNLTGESSFAPGVPTPGADVPPEGLTRTPSKQKTSRAVAASASAVASPIISLTDKPAQRSEASTTLVLPRDAPSTGLFALGVTVLATLTSGALTYARHLRKDEWDIVEEIGN